MSITDRAFIRAYSQDAESQGESPAASAPGAHPKATAGANETRSTSFGGPNRDYAIPGGAGPRTPAAPGKVVAASTGGGPRPHIPFPAAPSRAAAPARGFDHAAPHDAESPVLEISDSVLDDEPVDYYSAALHGPSSSATHGYELHDQDDEPAADHAYPTAVQDHDDESLRAAARSFRPALEVDAFLYTEQCEQLTEQLGDALTDVAQNLKMSAAAGQRVLAVAGCRRNEGRTTAVLCLARSLAAEGARVAVLDADFEKPELAEQMGLAAPVGWDGALRGEVNLSEAVVESRSDAIVVVALREPVADARRLVMHADTAAVVATLKHVYDIVLIDLGPLLDVAAGISALPFAQRAGIDAAILIRDARGESRGDVATAQRKLADVGVETLGIIETFSPPEVLPRTVARRATSR